MRNERSSSNTQFCVNPGALLLNGSGSAACFQGSEESTSASNGREGSRFAGCAKSTHTASGFSGSIGRKCQSIQTLLSFEEASSNQSISSAEASLARTSAPQENGQELKKEQDRVYGLSSPVLLGRLNPDGSLSRMSQGCCQSTLDGGWERYSTTFPFAGTMRNGIVSARPPSGRSIDVTGSLLWRTPDTSAGGTVSEDVLEEMANGVWITEQGRRRQLRLQDQVRHQRLWPTPTTTDAKGRGYTYDQGDKTKPRASLVGLARMFPTPTASCSTGAGLHGQGGLNLQTAIRLYPTPAGRDWKDSGLNTDYSQREGHAPGSPRVVGGQLNPTWVEWLMGFPLGWTDLEPSETLLSPRSRNTSGTASSNLKGVI